MPAIGPAGLPLSRATAPAIDTKIGIMLTAIPANMMSPVTNSIAKVRPMRVVPAAQPSPSRTGRPATASSESRTTPP